MWCMVAAWCMLLRTSLHLLHIQRHPNRRVEATFRVLGLIAGPPLWQVQGQTFGGQVPPNQEGSDAEGAVWEGP